MPGSSATRRGSSGCTSRPGSPPTSGSTTSPSARASCCSTARRSTRCSASRRPRASRSSPCASTSTTPARPRWSSGSRRASRRGTGGARSPTATRSGTWSDSWPTLAGDRGAGAMRLGRMLQAVDAHAAGEPGRVIVGGVLDVPGATMLEKARHLEAHGDGLRRLMLREPRGYPGLCANVILPPTRPEAQAGFVIMEHVEYPGMSGTNTICVVTTLLETGMLPMTEPVTELVLEAPAGLIRVQATCAGGKVTGVTFRNVPAFATHLDAPIEVPGVGTVVVDAAYGGMFSVIADAQALGFRLVPDEGRDITRITELVKAAAAEQLPVVHPDQPSFAGITIGQLSGPAHDARNSWRNVVTLSTGELDWSAPSTWTGVIDRSPCGTG